MKSNFEINDDVAVIKINKNIYPKEVIVQTTYVLLDDYYFLIDEDENYFLVSMSFKDKDVSSNLQTAVFEFFDELVESQAYLDQIERTSKTREIILERALLGQSLDDETIDSLNLDSQKE